MSDKLTKEAFTKLVEGDIAWLEEQSHTCERMHILAILRDAPRLYYPEVGPSETRSVLRDGGSGSSA